MYAIADLPVLLLVALLMAGCGIYDSHLAREYNEFAVDCAKMGLWNEAVVRWKRVIEIDPGNAKAHNNLGVAYESTGNFEMALAEYKVAMELDPDNRIYLSNYIKFKRNYERASGINGTQGTEKTQDSGDETRYPEP